MSAIAKFGGVPAGRVVWRRLLVDHSAWIFAAILMLIGTTVTPLFLTAGNLLNVLQQSAIIGIMAVGQFMVILTGGIDLSVGSLLALATMTGALGLSHGVLAGVALAMVTCGLCGAASGLMIAKGGLPPFIVTFGMMAVGRGLALTLTSGRPINVGRGSWLAAIGGGIWPELIWAGVIAAAYLLLRRFPLGRHIYATGGNPEGARVSGVRTEWILTLVYALSGSCAAVGGIVFMERSTVALPTSGLGYELQTIAAAVLGGTDLFGGSGRLTGVVVGVIILTLLSNILDLTGVNPFWNFIAIGIALWLAVMLRARLARRP